jgi:hypothetical protein
VLIVDLVTFLIGIGTLIAVTIPSPEQAPADDADESGKGLLSEMGYGFRYIMQRPGLLGLVLVFVWMNLVAALTYFSILPAMVLARTGGDELALASVQSALGVGGVVGALLMSTWGGPKRRIHGVLLAAALSFFTGDLLFAVGRNPTVWVIAAFAAAFFIPIITGSDSAIWQEKVPPGLQGRVLAARNAIRSAALPLGMLVAGPLADRVFEPAMMADGALVPIFGPLVGTGLGAGMAAMFVLTAFSGTVVSLSGYLTRVRTVEITVPDHDASTMEALAEGGVRS